MLAGPGGWSTTTAHDIFRRIRLGTGDSPEQVSGAERTGVARRGPSPLITGHAAGSRIQPVAIASKYTPGYVVASTLLRDGVRSLQPSALRTCQWRPLGRVAGAVDARRYGAIGAPSCPSECPLVCVRRCRPLRCCGRAHAQAARDLAGVVLSACDLALSQC
ncbi:hypothetical protein F1559_000371 [Cyanidiococcus yangmingshanensis]|uniref:Uncharacterized protein n=1 Tax=Cyanidiococcus yangmingshanensis TaxID=2690220 RepID=A0A7J7INQ0_9RHOD|nr:hypothetical protein F1559_000371 [Cyanidiococcus yangmingshanensis]